MRHSLTLLCLLLTAGSTLAHDTTHAPRQLTVSGSAEQWVTPDVASLRLSVEGRADSAEAALTTAASRSAQLIEALADFTEARFLRATDTRLHQVVKGTQRQWRRDSGEPVEMLARRDIQVQQLALEQLPAAMQALARLDLARIDDVSSRHAAADAVRDELLLEAIGDARARARRMARQLDVELGLPLSVDSDQPAEPPVALRAMAMRSESAGAGYEAAGSQQLRATVRIVFELRAP